MRKRGHLFGVEIVELDVNDTIPAGAITIPANTMANLGALREEIQRVRARNEAPEIVALVGKQPRQLAADLDEICGTWGEL